MPKVWVLVIVIRGVVWDVRVFADDNKAQDEYNKARIKLGLEEGNDCRLKQIEIE